MQTVQAAIDPERRNEPLVQAHLATLQSHLDYVSRPEGIFVDQQVTQQVFRGGVWQVYAFLYRRKTGNNHSRLFFRKNPSIPSVYWEDIKKISRKLIDQWRACGLGVKKLTPAEFYHWMAHWFNPKKTVQRQTVFIASCGSKTHRLGFCRTIVFFSAGIF